MKRGSAQSSKGHIWEVVTRERSYRSPGKTGRFGIEGDTHMIYPDGIRSFRVGKVQVVSAVPGPGDEVIRNRVLLVPDRRRKLVGRGEVGAVFLITP